MKFQTGVSSLGVLCKHALKMQCRDYIYGSKNGPKFEVCEKRTVSNFFS